MSDHGAAGEPTPDELVRLHTAALPLRVCLSKLAGKEKRAADSWAAACREHPELESGEWSVVQDEVYDLPAVQRHHMWQRQLEDSLERIGDALGPAKAAAYRVGAPLAPFRHRLPDLVGSVAKRAETLEAVAAVLLELEARLELAALNGASATAAEAEEERPAPAPETVDVTTAAARLGKGETTVRNWCRDARKPCHNAFQHAGRWCIPEADVPA